MVLLLKCLTIKTECLQNLSHPEDTPTQRMNRQPVLFTFYSATPFV